MIGFSDATRISIKRFVDFKGRSSRAEYWWVQLVLFLLLVSYFIALSAAFFFLDGMNSRETSSELLTAFIIIAGIYSLIFYALIIPVTSLTVRRLHDRDMSGWNCVWIYVSYIIPFLNIVAMIVVSIMFAQKGTVGSNRYGPDPMGRISADTFD